MSWYKDDEGQVFEVKDDRAVYLFEHRAVPKRKRKASSADIEAFMFARNLIWSAVTNNIGLAYAVAKRFPFQWREELVSEVGIPCLCRAALNYNKDMGSFSNYAMQWLRRRMYEWVKTKRAEQPLEDLRERSIVDSSKHDHRDAVLYALNGLPEYERMLLRLYFWEGLTYDDIALVAGVAKSTVSRHILLALKKCKHALRTSS